jgi:hypothetical protein
MYSYYSRLRYSVTSKLGPISVLFARSCKRRNAEFRDSRLCKVYFTPRKTRFECSVTSSSLNQKSQKNQIWISENLKKVCTNFCYSVCIVDGETDGFVQILQRWYRKSRFKQFEKVDETFGECFIKVWCLTAVCISVGATLVIQKQSPPKLRLAISHHAG